MDDRLALRSPATMTPPPDANRGVAPVDQREDNDDEKVYYGFGVFMGLPLADLRAMKDEYLQKHAMGAGGGGPLIGDDDDDVPIVGNSNSSNAGGSVRGQHGRHVPEPADRYMEYEMRDPMGRPHGMPTREYGGRGMPPPARDGSHLDDDYRGPPLPAMRGQAPPPPHRGYGHHPPPSAHRMHPGEYGPPHSGDRGHHSDDGSEGSDGSYSAPKSHSLNFILH